MLLLKAPSRLCGMRYMPLDLPFLLPRGVRLGLYRLRLHFTDKLVMFGHPWTPAFTAMMAMTRSCSTAFQIALLLNLFGFLLNVIICVIETPTL